MTEACIFCEIIVGRAPASFVYRDETCAVFMDLHPVNPGHALVVPNEHATHLAGLGAEHGAHMFRVAQRVAAALRASRLPCEGVNLFLADGAAAGQDVFHVHLHVIPRYRGDGFGFKFPPGYGLPAARADLARTAAALQGALS